MRTSGSREAAGHEAGHRRIDQGLTGLAEALVVLAEAAAVPQPRKGPLHRPPARQDATETCRAQGRPVDLLPGDHPHAAWLPGMLDDLNGPTQLLLDPGLAGAGVALVDPGVTQARELLVGPGQELRQGRPFLERRAVDVGPEDQPEGVDQEVALAAVEPLGSVVAVPPPRSVVLTLWLSRIAALGVGRRPCRVRSWT
jgi:hypothetical protein